MLRFQSKFLLLLLLLVSSAVVVVHGQQNPKWVLTTAKLPVEAQNLKAVYDDRDDSIYLVGGFNPRSGPYQNQIWKYSLQNETVDVLGPFVSAEWGGAALGTSADQVVYLGGLTNSYGTGPAQTYSADVTLFNSINKTSSVVNSLPVGLDQFGTAWDPFGRVAYLWGGEDRYSGSCIDSILRYNSSNNAVEQVATMPICKSRGAAAWDTSRNVAYYIDNVGNEITQYNVTSGNVTVLSTHMPYSPDFPAAVYVDAEDAVYVLEFRATARFDPSAQTAVQVFIDDWPYLQNVGYVYVPRLDRIYMFGGQGGSSSWYQDQISYIDFGRPLPTPTTTTTTQATTTTTTTTTTKKPTTTTTKATTTQKPLTNNATTTKNPVQWSFWG